MPNEDGSTAEETARSFNPKWYADPRSFDWSFLDRIFRGTIYAGFLSLIGIITSMVESVERAADRAIVGVVQFFADWSFANDITASFASAQRSLATFPPWAQFMAALGIVLLATWALDLVRTVIADA